MKRIILICLLFLIALPAWSSAAAIGPARVSYVDGDTLFRAPDSDEWLPAAANTPLDEGDAFWCPEGSRAEIQLPDGSVIRLDGGSQLDLLANEDGFVHLHLASGHLYLRTIQTFRENSLQIDADDTTVIPAARTRLRIDMLENSLEDVAITKGAAYVEGNGNRTRVRAGEHILLEEGHSEVLPLNPADEWEVWNVDRDRSQSRSVKPDSALPDELRGHAAELDANGTWVTVPEYGTVWRPTVIVSDGWAPYRDGRWFWRGDDYIWLSYEPWGWVPYHFGRWAVVVGFGWCWVPPVRGDVYWGPGYVGWYRTGSYVGWTPLAPGEVFYGHRNYGRHSVNITGVSISTSTIVYRNRSNPGGLTVLPHNDFLRGRNAIRQPSRNSSVSVSVSIGSPRIKPLRETRMPIIKQTPPRVAPPRIEHRDSRELRSRFPRVVPEASAERRRQQQAPPRTSPASPSIRPQQDREKKTTYPIVAPAGRAPEKDRQPSQTTPTRRDERRPGERPPQAPSQPATKIQRPEQPVREQREERRQITRPPQAASQPAAPASPSQPSVSVGGQQRTGQPRRTAVPAENQNRPAVLPSRGEGRPVTTNVPAAVPPKPAVPQRVEQPRIESAPREIQQRKVWKITTPENGSERDVRGNDNRGRERRER
ncbi:MAG: FecR domain-containing protein [Geobacteraceae bacterium]|nr:FecR domain-containing protein [Geobacteraceae bacterium]